MKRIRDILSCLSREDLLYGLASPPSLQPLTEEQVEAVADACAPNRQALEGLRGDLLIFRLARVLAERHPFQAIDGEKTALINLRAFCFLTLYIAVNNGRILSGQCPYRGRRCINGAACARGAVKRFLKRPVFNCNDKAQETLDQITRWHHTDFLLFVDAVIGTTKRCQWFQGSLVDP